MAEKSFSWLPEDHEASINDPEKMERLPQEDTLLMRVKRKIISEKFGILIFLTLITCLLILKIVTPPEKEISNHKIEIMTSTLPLSKGSLLENAFLRPVLFNEYSISKNQKMEILTFEATEKIMGKIRAKKDIPPHKPIFWSDLELVPENKKTQIPTQTKVFFSEEKKEREP